MPNTLDSLTGQRYEVCTLPSDQTILENLGCRLSGSAGTLTASRNNAGPYIRTRTTPTDPATTRQVEMRDLMTDITQIWRDSLADFHRTSWTTYAANVPLPNRLGRRRHVTPLNHFVRGNIIRAQCYRAMNLNAPTIFDLGHPIDLFNVRAHKNSITLTFNFDDSADWCSELGSFIAIYASRSQAPSINFYNGPYELLGTCPNTALEYPVSPFRIDLVAQPTVDYFTFVRVLLARLDGRTSITRQYRAPTTLL